MLVLLALVLASFLSAQPAPDTKRLASEVIANEWKNFSELGEYTFNFELVRRTFNKSGAIREETASTGESYMSHRGNIDIALTWNGKPLKPKDLDKQRKNARARLEADYKVRQSAGPVPPPRDSRAGPGMLFNKVRMSAVDVLRYCALGPGIERSGLWIYRFDRCNSPWREESHYPRMRGHITVHPVEKRVESWYAETLEGVEFYRYNTQLAPDGVRVLARNHLNCNAAKVVCSEPVEWIYRWTDPKKFAVEVDQTIATPQI